MSSTCVSSGHCSHSPIPEHQQIIKELIEGVEEEYHNYDVDKLAKSFLTLQYCMAEVMKVGGGNHYDSPHKKKEHQQEEGMLPSAISITAELLAQTKALIEVGKAENKK